MKFRIAATASMALALGLTACGAPSEDAADDGPIPVGMIADLSGATADVGTPYHEGMLGYVDWLNENGGIEGREIEALAEDYAYNPDNAVTLYDRFIDEGAVVIQGWGTGDTNILAEKVTNDEMPFMSASYDESLTDPSTRPYNFVVAATYSDQMRVALNWIAEDSGGNAEVAAFHHDSAFGEAPLADGEAWIEEQGLGLSMTTYPMPAEGNMVGLLTQADNKGTKYIVIQNVSTPAANVARDLAAQGHDMKIVCLVWCSDDIFIDVAGEAAEGHMMVQPFASTAADAEGFGDVQDYLESQGSSLEEEGLHYAQGWYTMHAMAEGIRGALEEDGSLSGEAIKESLENNVIETGGVAGDGTIEFSSDSHRGSTSSGIYEVVDGEMSVVELGVNP